MPEFREFAINESAFINGEPVAIHGQELQPDGLVAFLAARDQARSGRVRRDVEGEPEGRDVVRTEWGAIVSELRDGERPSGILGVLLEYSEMSAGELAGFLGRDTTDVARALTALVDSGLVVSSGPLEHRRYSLPTLR